MFPLVSICIPTFNGEAYLQEALDSILQQNSRDFEVIISDDQSTDDTLKIANKFKEAADFPVKIYNHSPKGIGANWNNCIKKAKSKYIKFLFQDDVLYPTCIKKMVSVLESYPKIALVASKRDFIVESSASSALTSWLDKYKDLQATLSNEENNVLVLDKSLFKSIEFLNSPFNKIGEPSVVMFRSNIIKKVGMFNEELKQILDYEFYYRILKRYKVAILPEKLAGFRVHGLQESEKNNMNNVNEKFIFDKILYRFFFRYLRIDHKKELFLKFNPLLRKIIKLISKPAS